MLPQRSNESAMMTEYGRPYSHKGFGQRFKDWCYQAGLPFIHEGDPPADQPLELLCEDHVGTYVIPFLCRLSSGVWRSVDAGERIEATVIGWRTR
jgi:hypothetical protein